MADRLALSIRNYLAQQEDLRALLGKGTLWDTWVFADKPSGKVENTGTSMVVISQQGSWTDPNEHNTLTFPQILVDVWSDPTRNADKSIRVLDADDKILAVHRVISKYLHVVDNNRKGKPLCWGTAEQMANNTGALIDGSTRRREVDFANMLNNDGGRMGTVVYGVKLI